MNRHKYCRLVFNFSLSLVVLGLTFSTQIAGVFALSATYAAAQSANSATGSKPNIILIVGDDVGWG